MTDQEQSLREMAKEIRRLTDHHVANLRAQGEDELADRLERTALDVQAIAEERED